MCKQHYALYLFYVLIFGKLSSCITDDESEKKLYSNKWVVRVDGGIAEANRIARRHGFKNLGQVGSLEGFYHFQHDDHPVRSRRSVDERTARLSDELSVEFAEQQIIKRRVKRDFNLNDPLFPKQWFILKIQPQSAISGGELPYLWKPKENEQHEEKHETEK